MRRFFRAPVLSAVPATMAGCVSNPPSRISEPARPMLVNRLDSSPPNVAVLAVYAEPRAAMETVAADGNGFYRQFDHSGLNAFSHLMLLEPNNGGRTLHLLYLSPDEYHLPPGARYAGGSEHRRATAKPYGDSLGYGRAVRSSHRGSHPSEHDRRPLHRARRRAFCEKRVELDAPRSAGCREFLEPANR